MLKRTLLSLALAALCAGGLTHLPVPPPAPVVPLATVDYGSVFRQHPDYQKVQELDAQIERLQAEACDIDRKAKESGQSRLQQAARQSRAELEAERAKVLGHLNELKASAEAEMAAQLRNFHPDVNPDLRLLRDRNLAARRMEREKAMGQEISAEQARLEAALSAYTDRIAAQYQEEKINLQLSHQNASDPAEKQKLEDRLAAIGDAIENARAAKRQEVAGQLARLRDQKRSEAELELNRYSAKLDTEFRSQLPQGILQSELTAMRKEFEVHMTVESARATARLHKRAEEIQLHLQSLEREVLAQLNGSPAELLATQERLAAVQGERKKLAAHITGQVDKLVARVAQKHHVKAVVARTPYNDGALPDLTDWSVVAVKESGMHN